MYTTIIPFKKSFDDIWLTYIVPTALQKEIKIGQIVEIPFKWENELGIVYELSKDLLYDIDISKLKEISSIKNENIFISSYRLPLVRYISKKYYTPIHNSINLFFPKNLKEKVKKWKLKFSQTSQYSYSFDFNINLTKAQEKAYQEIINSKNNKILLFWITWSWKTEI